MCTYLTVGGMICIIITLVFEWEAHNFWNLKFNVLRK